MTLMQQPEPCPCTVMTYWADCSECYRPAFKCEGCGDILTHCKCDHNSTAWIPIGEADTTPMANNIDVHADVIIACITNAPILFCMHPQSVHMSFYVGHDGHVHTTLFQRSAWKEPTSVMFDMYPQHYVYTIMLKLRMLNRMWRDAVATANPPIAYVGRLESFLQGRRDTESTCKCMPPTLCMPCDIDTAMPWWKESHVCNYDREGVCYSCGYTDGVIVGACVCGNIWCTLCDGVDPDVLSIEMDPPLYTQISGGCDSE